MHLVEGRKEKGYFGGVIFADAGMASRRDRWKTTVLKHGHLPDTQFCTKTLRVRR
jgi:hypothetical protein